MSHTKTFLNRGVSVIKLVLFASIILATPYFWYLTEVRFPFPSPISNLFKFSGWYINLSIVGIGLILTLLSTFFEFGKIEVSSRKRGLNFLIRFSKILSVFAFLCCAFLYWVHKTHCTVEIIASERIRLSFPSNIPFVPATAYILEPESSVVTGLAIGKNKITLSDFQKRATKDTILTLKNDTFIHLENVFSKPTIVLDSNYSKIITPVIESLEQSRDDKLKMGSPRPLRKYRFRGNTYPLDSIGNRFLNIEGFLGKTSSSIRIAVSYKGDFHMVDSKMNYYTFHNGKVIAAVGEDTLEMNQLKLRKFGYPRRMERDKIETILKQESDTLIIQENDQIIQHIIEFIKNS